MFSGKQCYQKPSARTREAPQQLPVSRRHDATRSKRKYSADSGGFQKNRIVMRMIIIINQFLMKMVVKM
ncbi:hypothetical protein [Collimonas humicola]|uniref:hypothetical protein n=1 Tax=Collimonas humicola TaxID=2825886 RepID=UPI001B8C3D86|nr:hypothetical protein [Collimonas humicola]